MPLHDRLLAWFELADRVRQLEVFDSLFVPDATLDAEIPVHDRVRTMIEDGVALEDIRPLVARGDETGGVVVFEARDPVTNLWHRRVWTFAARNNLITDVVATTSQGLPSPEEGGRSTARP